MESTVKTLPMELVVNVIKGSEGKIFRIDFIKRTTGELRTMVCRIGVSKGITGEGLKFNPNKQGLQVVWDMQKENYRMINLDAVISIKLSGQEYETDYAPEAEDCNNCEGSGRSCLDCPIGKVRS